MRKYCAVRADKDGESLENQRHSPVKKDKKIRSTIVIGT